MEKQKSKIEEVWMPYEQYLAEEQYRLKQLAKMFPTLKGLLWDTVEKSKQKPTDENTK